MRSLAIVPIVISILLLSILAVGVNATTRKGNLSFSNTPLLRPDGNSEPEISIGADGTMVMVGLSWQEFFTNLWKGPFGQTPVYQGGVDAALGSNIGGGGDADVDIGSTGTLHVSTLVFFFNPQTQITQLGVSAITCPNTDTSNNFANCFGQIIDTTQSDRQWVTSDGPHVYISYHDSGSSTKIHVQRSDDDGYTWHKVTDPITGQDGITGQSTFNNDQGKIIADPYSHNVYTVWVAGVAGLQKGSSANFNNVYVAVSNNMGQSWTPHLVYSGTVNVALNNIFPAMAIDPLTGVVSTAWSDAHNTYFSISSDQGVTWSKPVIVNISPAITTVFPWLAARAGTIDLTYYGTTASSKDDTSAVWNVYLAQSTDSGVHWTQSLVSSHPNHVGVICTNGTGCQSGTRNLLDLFQVAIDPQNGKSAIIYTDDTLTTTSSGSPLPQVVLAQQN